MPIWTDQHSKTLYEGICARRRVEAQIQAQKRVKNSKTSEVACTALFFSLFAICIALIKKQKGERNE